MSKQSDGQKRNASPGRAQAPGVSCDICHAPDDSRMVACDVCEMWYHFICVGVDESVQERDWSCDKCRNAAVQVSVGPSTSTGAGGTARPGSSKPSDPEAQELQKQLIAVQKRLKDFERVMKEKDERYRRGLTELHDKHQRELGDTERRVRDQFEGRRNVACFEGGPAASSTGNPLPQIVLSGIGQSEDTLSQQLKLLEERQALEKKHLEERNQLLQRFGQVDGGSVEGGSGSNARTNMPQTTQAARNSSFLDVPWLSQSQISARQGISRELPIFTGVPEEWPLFIASYEHSTRLCGYSDEENLLRVQRSLKGKALDVVRCRLLHPSNLPGVIDTLRTLFGRPEIIVHSLVHKIREMPSPKAEKLQTLIDFGVAVQNVCATIKASGLDEYLCNVALLHELSEKLPPTIRLNWAYHQQTLGRVTLSDFGDWLGKLVEAASIVTLPSFNTTKPERRGRREDNYLNVHSEEPYEATNAVAVPRECLLCRRQCSNLATCEKFLSMNISSRWTVIKERKLCRKCLRKHFGACSVKTPCGKNGCSFMHNKLLHDDKRYNSTKSTTAESKPTTSQSCNTHSNVSGKVLFRYVPVTIHGDGKTVQTFAFLDDGSSATFIERSLVEELNLKGVPHPLCLNWTGGQQRDEKDSVKLALKISGTHNAGRLYELPKVHTVRSLSLPKQSLPVPQMVESYSYLKGLPLESYAEVSPRILIGMDNCRLGHALRSAEGGENEPVASKTRLGWLLYGPCSSLPNEEANDPNDYHSYHICPCSADIDRNLDAALREYFSVDALGISSSKLPISKDDERALQILSSETKFKSGRYETGLLWRYDRITFPDSKMMALKRLHCLEKKMNREPELAATMRTKMAEFMQKGYIRRLTESEKAQTYPRDWYLPIFPVINPNKPGKIRIVFDAAAKVNNISLNSFLLTGPDQLVSLLGVLYKFREYRVAIVGDIREMFFQVQMKIQDQRSQMILWRSQGPESEPDVYAVAVMTFGAACSPSCAHYVKNLNADRFVEQYPRAVVCIKEEHYVDDMLASIETEEEAITLAREVQMIHSRGGFEIRNWQSNSSNDLKCMKQNSSEDKNMNLSSEMATEKVLGMYWNTSTDTFTFRLSPKHDADLLSGAKIPTKREVLRTLMAIYDPMGLISNFLVYLKILLQEIWRSDCGWDDEIEGKLVQKWMTWISALPNVRRVTIPRCYRKITSANPTNNVQLHIFCDASENGMAAVAYLRFDEHSTVECALVGSKTKVAPIKYLSIPRLELQAAVIGARLAENIVKTHRMKISRRVFWTDSRDVVCWLRSDHRRYSQFVAFRISELLDTTKVGEWRWLPTKSNVADDGTKWERLPELHPTSRWFRGPEFLWGPESEWPGYTTDQGSTMEEIKPNVMKHSVTSPVIQVERFSKWKRLLRSVAYVYRFSVNVRRRLKKEVVELGPLSQEELLWAENAIYKQVQKSVYKEEIQLLKGHQSSSQPWRSPIPKSSPLYKLSPFMDQHGVLRMQGRIGSCLWVDEATKNPILLPRRNYVTDLIVADYHAKYRHLNHQTAINHIRQKYYIPRLRSEFGRLRKSCQHCKIKRATPVPPMMGNLPPARLAAFQRPFSYTGIDYFGPMSVLVGRRVEKRWGVLLTCMTTRGVHIELAHSLTTDSCILALRNFIARRGSPLEIISDRGTNFVGASRELAESFHHVDTEKLMTEFTSPNTKWTFNPPAAPHFGGCWERLIQSVKKTLNEFDPPRLPTDEILRSILTEIEMMLNSRPLTDIPLDSDAEHPLTPNHFLLGTPDGSKPPIAFDDDPKVIKQSWKMAQSYANKLWKKWVEEYIPTLTRRSKWFLPVKPVQEGDLVLVVDQNFPRNCWPRGRVVKVVLANDGQVRRVTVQTANGLLERPATKIAVLDVGSSRSKPLQD